MGMGLAVVTTIIDANGGEVTVSTSPLGGAAVMIEIPVFSETNDV